MAVCWQAGARHLLHGSGSACSCSKQSLQYQHCSMHAACWHAIPAALGEMLQNTVSIIKELTEAVFHIGPQRQQIKKDMSKARNRHFQLYIFGRTSVGLSNHRCCPSIIEQPPRQILCDMHNTPEFLADHAIVQNREMEGSWHFCTPYAVMTPPPYRLAV